MSHCIVLLIVLLLHRHCVELKSVVFFLFFSCNITDVTQQKVFTCCGLSKNESHWNESQARTVSDEVLHVYSPIRNVPALHLRPHTSSLSPPFSCFLVNTEGEAWSFRFKVETSTTLKNTGRLSALKHSLEI